MSDPQVVNVEIIHSTHPIDTARLCVFWPDFDTVASQAARPDGEWPDANLIAHRDDGKSALVRFEGGELLVHLEDS